MFKHPGERLKEIAAVWFWTVALFSGFLSYRLATLEEYLYDYGDFDFKTFLIVLVAGMIFAYVSSLGLAAFGELVENSTKIHERLKQKERKQPPKPSVDYAKKFAVSSGKKEVQSDYLKRTLERMDKENR